MSDSPTTDHHQADRTNKAENPPITVVDMLQQLAASGYIVPQAAGYAQLTMPSAYRFVPSLTTTHSIPPLMRSETI